MEVLTLGKVFGIVSESGVSGMEVKERFPRLSLGSLWKGACQEGLERWLAARLCLRVTLVRIDNQINYSLFDEISSKANTKVILGVNKWLFEKAYVDSFNNLDAVPSSVLEGKIQSLKKLQIALKEKGIPFLFAITPSKASIYPEYINPKYLIANKQEKDSNYYKIVPLLNKYKINYIDGHQFFVDLKRRSPYLLYPQSGTHWNYYSAYLFTVELISRLTKMLNKDLVNIRCEDIKVSNTPQGNDADLAELCNIFFSKSLYGQYLYPKTAPSPNQGTAFRPKILFVGGSYLYTLFYYMDKHQIYSERVLYFYNKTRKFYPKRPDSPVDTDARKLRNEVLAQDVIIVEANEETLGRIGFGFVEDTLNALDSTHD
jgi:hypothetical protein